MAVTRRAALAVALVGAGAASASVAGDPDAVLIRLCRQYVAAMQRFNDIGGDSGTCPIWAEVEAAADRLEGVQARTWAGVRAKAELVEYLARMSDGRMDYDTSFTGRFPGEIVQDVLRLTA